MIQFRFELRSLDSKASALLLYVSVSLKLAG